jgi:hypothetical protein
MNKTKALRILHLEDKAGDAELIQRALTQEDLASEVQVITSRSEYLTALDNRQKPSDGADSDARPYRRD